MAVQVYKSGGVLSSQPTGFSNSATSTNTLCAWIYANDSTVWNQRTSMVGLYGPGAAPTTAFQMGCFSAGDWGCWTWGGTQIIGLPGHAPVNQWNHYTVTYDGSTALLYINGVLQNTATFTQQSGNLTQTFINGYPTGADLESGNFSVDDVIFFNRVLSVQEIQTIYNLKGPRDGIFAGVLARYTYDEGVINSNVVVGKDLSISGAHMTPSAGTAPTYTQPYAMSNLRRTI